MRRWSEKKSNPWRYKQLYFINPFFVILWVGMMMIFSVYSRLYQFVFSDNKIDLFAQNISELALYFSPFDQLLADQFLSVDKLKNGYVSGDNIFVDHRPALDWLIEYVTQHREYLINLWFSRYRDIFMLISEALVYKDELYILLWSQEPKHYLVILQNVAEKRPNGWFFWSFAFVTVDQARIIDVDIIDTYFPNAIAPGAFIPTPSRSHSIMSPKMWFLSSNRFWFTDMDGENIKKLYELIFWWWYKIQQHERFFNSERYNKLFYQQIAWVVFIRSDILTALIPWFEQRLQERQFVNASIDIIRWVNISNKKELYIKEVNEYFDSNKGQIFMNLINNFSKIQENNYIQAYIPGASSWLQQFIADYWFNVSPQPNTLYAWDNNDSFNKSDTFITKHTTITTTWWSLLRETDKDIVNPPMDIITYAQQSPVMLTISYSLNIPQRYKSFIQSLTEKYDIQITSRELSILALEPVTWINPIDPIMRKTQWHLYYPKNRSLVPLSPNLTWFEAPFAKWRRYTSTIRENNATTSQQFMLSIDDT